MIFSGNIPEGNEHWEIFLEYREITDMLLAEEVPEAWIPYLEYRIEQFLQRYMSTYPDASVTPKMHFMVHYPRIVSQLGPLVQYWCMRFEAKHQYFKRLATRTMNFRNIAKTMASRHQLLQGYQLSSLGATDILCTGQKKANRDDLPAVLQSSVTDTENMWKVKSVSWRHSTYRVGDVLIMKKGENPKFSLVDSIYMRDQAVFLIMAPLEVEHFRRHRFSYLVSQSGELQICHPGDEVSPQRLDLYFGAEIVPRCEVFI